MITAVPAQTEITLVDTFARQGYNVDSATLSQIKALLESSTQLPAAPLLGNDKEHVETASALAPKATIHPEIDIASQSLTSNINPPGHLGSSRFGGPNGITGIRSRWGGQTQELAPAFDLPLSSALPPPVLPAQEALELAYVTEVPEDILSDGGWTPHSMIRNWVQNVQVTPITPPSQSPPPSPPSLTRSLDPSKDANGRGHLTPDAGDDVSDVDTDLPTPEKAVQESSESEVATVIRPAAVSPPRPPLSSTTRTEDRRTFNSYGEDDRRPPRSDRRLWESSGKMWKRDPHPAFSTLFLKRRILVS